MAKIAAGKVEATSDLLVGMAFRGKFRLDLLGEKLAQDDLLGEVFCTDDDLRRARWSAGGEGEEKCRD